MYFCGVILEPEYMRSFRRITKDHKTKKTKRQQYIQTKLNRDEEQSDKDG
jgi:hypothetical protein